MLLFNNIQHPPVIEVLYFNTSNVTIQLYVPAAKLYFLYISIHLMLLFNTVCKGIKTERCIISIHLMLLFNDFPKLIKISVRISIHLMLLFNLILFQIHSSENLYFNTSNVTIQRTLVSKI